MCGGVCWCYVLRVMVYVDDVHMCGGGCLCWCVVGVGVVCGRGVYYVVCGGMHMWWYYDVCVVMYVGVMCCVCDGAS